MTHEFRLADIGEGLEEAEIISWLVQVGDRVERDQPLIEVMTDKSNAELPAPVAGTVIDLSGQVGDIIHVGALIAIIDENADSLGPAPVSPPAAELPRVASVSSSTAAPTSASTVAPSADPSGTQSVSTARPKASPSTRRAAAERGIDLSAIHGSGPGGRILLADLDGSTSLTAATAAATAQPPVAPVNPPAPVTAAPAAPPAMPQPVAAAPAAPPVMSEPVATAPPVSAAPPEPVTAAPAASSVAFTTRATPAGARTEPLRGVRRAVAQNMARSWAEIPHIHSFAHIDAVPMLDMRARLRETSKPAYASLTPLAFFVAAVARALRTHPQANASIDMVQDEIIYHGGVNVGIAVAAPQGLVVPVLHQADQLDFEDLATSLQVLITGARQGTLAPNQYRKGTVTITNFGSLGGEQAVPIIRSPESMIFGFGSIAERPFVVDSTVVAQKTMHLVAGADHRLLDGDTTTAVLTNVIDSLTEPLRLVL